jgi:Uma2 family endonuclease
MGPLGENLKDRYTYGDYLTWIDGERWELIDGAPYNMTPAPNRRHQQITVDLTRQFANFLLDKPCRVYVVPFDVRLPEADEVEADITTVVQPDISVICDPVKLDDAGCIGAPDLIVEILSPSTSLKDHREKFNRYERAGVKEYWLVDPANRLVTVFILGEDKTFDRADVYGDEDKIAVRTLPGLEVDLLLAFRDIV